MQRPLCREIKKERCYFMSENSKTPADLLGCRFQVSPLSGDFVPIILGAIKGVNTEKIWGVTEMTSTVYRGRRVHVVDCVKAFFSNVVDGIIYVTLSAKFCKGDDDFEKDCVIAKDDVLLNDNQKSFDVIGRLSFYASEDSKKHSDAVIDLAVKKGIYTRTGYYASFFKGNVHDVFDFINDVLAYGEKIPHYVFDVTVSAFGEPKEGMIDYGD